MRKNIEMLFSFYIKLNYFFGIVETCVVCTYIFERMEPQFLDQFRHMKKHGGIDIISVDNILLR